LTSGDRERYERSPSESRNFRAVQSRDVRAKTQGNDLKRLRELLPQTRGTQPEVGFPGTFNRKPLEQGQGERMQGARASPSQALLASHGYSHFPVRNNGIGGSPAGGLQAVAHVLARVN
jgi:hypothetical protein